MKKTLFYKIFLFIIAILLCLTAVSCKRTEENDHTLSHDDPSENCIKYTDKNGNDKKYDIAQNDVLSDDFIVDKTIELSSLAVSVNGISKKDSSVYVDFTSESFDAISDTDDINSVLESISKNLLSYSENTENVIFSVDGKNYRNKNVNIIQNSVFESKTPAEKKEISYKIKYYDVINDTDSEKEFTETVSKNITPEYFIDKLSELSGLYICINKITIDGENMTIDFSKNYPPFSGVGSLEESKLLENIRDIMFSQYPEVKCLFFTADGGQYESGHMYISKDEPYAER